MSGAPGTTQGRWHVAPWSTQEAAVMAGKSLVSGGYALKPDAYQMAASQRMYDVLLDLRNECSGTPDPDRLMALLAQADKALSLARGEQVA